MLEHIAIALTTIISLGMIAQWIAWRFQIPSILLLLLAGFLIGPVLGFLQPDELFKSLLFPFISFSVAIILFEGGLELNFKDLTKVGGVVRNLVTLGSLVTWVLSALALYFIVKLEFSLSVLLGAILIVTGPTVIGPLLKHMHLKRSVGSVLKWEGIVIDPIGAMLAVLVFGAILSGGFQEALAGTALGLLRTVFIGGVVGMLGAGVMIYLLKHYWLPDFLQSPVSLMMVLLVTTISNSFQAEAGLLSATLMGVCLANQKSVNVKRIVEFKESLRILLISGLFIILSARMELEQLMMMDWNTVIFIALLIFVIRPLSVFVSTLGSELHWKEKLLLSFMAPRGIVAAAVAAVFAFELIEHGFSSAFQLVSITFIVIVSTVFIYSIISPKLAIWLGLSTPNPQGVLMLGAHRWARSLALAIKKAGIDVLLIDTNYANVSSARIAGLYAVDKDALSQHSGDELDFEGLGRMIALTPNDEVNSLAAVRYHNEFGTSEVYQLSPKKESESQQEEKEKKAHYRGRYLFGKKSTYTQLEKWFDEGAEIKLKQAEKDFNLEEFLKKNQESIVPLFIVTPSKELFIFATDKLLSIKAEQTLIYLELKN